MVVSDAIRIKTVTIIRIIKHIQYIFKVSARNRIRDFNEMTSFKIWTRLGEKWGMLRQLETSIKGSCLSKERNYVIRAWWYLEPWRSSWPTEAIVMEGQDHFLNKEGAEKYSMACTFSHFQISCQGLPLTKPNPKPESVETKVMQTTEASLPGNRATQRREDKGPGEEASGKSISNNQNM